MILVKFMDGSLSLLSEDTPCDPSRENILKFLDCYEKGMKPKMDKLKEVSIGESRLIEVSNTRMLRGTIVAKNVEVLK